MGILYEIYFNFNNYVVGYLQFLLTWFILYQWHLGRWVYYDLIIIIVNKCASNHLKECKYDIWTDNNKIFIS